MVTRGGVRGDVVRFVVAAKALSVARRRFQESVYRRLGLSVSQSDCLFYAATRGSTRQADLVELLGVSRSAVTLLVSDLCARGLVTRRGDPDDKRAVRVVATDAGLHAFGSSLLDLQAALDRSTPDLDGTSAVLEHVAAVFAGVVAGDGRVSAPDHRSEAPVARPSR